MARPEVLAKELNDTITLLDQRLDKLRANYEQYFQGIERVQPSQDHQALRRLIYDLRKVFTRNTALKFRINQLIAKLNTYENYWNRVVKQIEDGTYHRDVFKARFRAKQKERIEQQQDKPDGIPDIDVQPPAAQPRPAPTPKLSDNQVNAIYNAYVTAKRRCKESTKGLTPNAVAKSLQKQVPALIKKYKCKSVEFKVVIKGGKAILKAVPKF